MQLEELKEHKQRRENELATKRIERLRAIQYQATTISPLFADTAWEPYVRYIEGEKAKLEISAKAQQAALLDMVTPLLPQDELKAKLRLAHNQGSLEAYNVAMSIAERLVSQGEAAREEIEELLKKA